MRVSSVDSSSSSNSEDEKIKFRAIYAKQLKKKQALEVKRAEKERDKLQFSQLVKTQASLPPIQASHCLPLPLYRNTHQQQQTVFEYPSELRWFIYQKCPKLQIKERVPYPISELPIFRKKDEIMDSIIKNQFVLVTGETGCGKSTQVPRLIYQYLLSIGNKDAKIMCVQPRRLAVINLQIMLEKQMVEKKLIGYQIGMKSHITPQNRIVFVTNGIFMQRLVHSTDFFNEFPFIILDQVHERDIDTDFILLTIKRVIRQHPKVRIVLMSATIDNQLFRYYFASDHIDNILTEQNFYKKVIRSKEEARRQKMEDEDDEPDSDSRQDEKIYATHSFGFIKSKFPCPNINVTEPGKFSRAFYYLDTLADFLPKELASIRWGSVIFSEKYPNTHKELYQSVCQIIDQISKRHQKNVYKPSVLIFMPGLAEIENLSEYITMFFKTQRIKAQFDLIHVHSSILNDQITEKLLEKQGTKYKVIISTNIAQSSITVMGVQYVIDFCLSKEVRFDLKSRMENLELVWTSKASCNQRAGRTGRVCDGTIFRLLQRSFYQKLQNYSTPEIQRSSLDKLILRIKLLHEGEHNSIFADPGEVLGSAIQPPNLKNIDTSINSLKFSGGLQWREGQSYLTNLGRLYVDIPIDITYCKLLVISQLFGTFWDMLTLVSILSQSKNVIRRGSIERNYMIYYNLISNKDNCDFLGLLKLFEKTETLFADKSHNRNIRDPAYSVILEIYREVIELRNDIEKRMEKKNLFPMMSHIKHRKWKLNESKLNQQKQDYLLRFKMTLICGFMENMLKVRPPLLDEKQEKRLRLMKKVGIRHKNTVCLLGSTYIKKPDTLESEERLINSWNDHLRRTAQIPDTTFTLTYGLSYLHFKAEEDLYKFLFFRYIEQNKKTFCQDISSEMSRNGKFLSVADILKCLGQMDHMHSGRPVTFFRDQTVLIDNYSLNRVVNFNEGDVPKFLIASNIAKQSFRMVARYTSLLPLNIKYLEVIVHLLFHPFVSVGCNRMKTRYEALQLSKKRNRAPIHYNLSNAQIQKANQIRKVLRDYLSLNPKLRENPKFGLFKSDVINFVFAERQEVIEEERWQQVYMKQMFEQRPDLKYIYQQMMATNSISQQMNSAMDIEEKQGDRGFINEIKPIKLSQNFFSNLNIGDTTLEWRANDYNFWKQKKLKEVRAIQRKAEDKDSYLACGEDSCGLRIAKLSKVGPINGQIFRELFEIEAENIQELEFNDMDCHFCTLLMSNYIDSEYKTYGCKNGHYFAIKIECEKRLKILPFSQLMIIYPDGSADKAEFEKLQIKDWKRKHDEKSQSKYKLKLSTYCFVCDEIMDSFKALEYHIKESKHGGNVSDFIKTIPGQLREKREKEEEDAML